MTAPQSPLATPHPWNLVADAYTTDIVPIFEAFANDALLVAEVGPDERVLDVAAGPGTLSLLARDRGARVHALDFSPAMIAQLRTRALERRSQLEAQVGDGMALPYEDASFDAGFSMFGLMFFPDRVRGFRELHRVLRPGGRAVVASWAPMDRVPLLNEVFAAIRDQLPGMPFGQAQPPLGDAASFTAEMSEGGFTDVSIREVTHGFEVASPEEFLESTRRSNAPFVLLKERLGEEGWSALADAVLRRLKERFGPGPQRVEMTALLGFGRKA